MATGRVPTTANSPLTAKGDLFGYSTTQARVAVGSDGETLVADSSTSTGLRYQGSMAAGRNFFINGGMDIWQRGTSIALTTSALTSDRWQGYRAVAGSTVTRQATGDTTNLPFIQYCARVQRDSGNTAINTIYLGQSLETVNSIPLAGKTVTLSFYARAGANYSSASNALTLILRYGTGTDQNVITAGYTGSTNVISETATLTTTWQRFTYTGTIATTATEIGLQFSNTPVGTAGAADYFEVTGVQLEVGSVATQFSRAGGTIQGELAACQRYYFRTGQGASTLYEPFATWSGAYNTTTIDPIVVPAPVTMRVNPTALEFANIAVGDGVNLYSGGTWSLSSFGSEQMLAAKYQHGSAALTAFRSYLTNANNSTSGYLAFSAEL